MAIPRKASPLELWYPSFSCFITHTRTHAHTHTHICRHSRQPHIDGIVMTRTCLIRPGPWQGSRSDRGSSIIQGSARTWETYTHSAKEKEKKNEHTLMGEIAGAAGCWVTGVETRGESGNYSLAFFPPLPFKEKQLAHTRPPSSPRLWKHPISIHISFTQFKTHTSFAPSASPPFSSSISFSQLGHASNLRHYLCWPFI